MIRIQIFFLCLFLFASAVVTAKDSDKSTNISPRIYKQLKKSELLIKEKSYQQAVQALKAILKNVKPASYEKAIVLRSLSSVHALQGQYKRATQKLVIALKLEVFPETQKQQALLNLGQLYMATEQYRQAIQTLIPWLTKNPSKDVQLRVLIANAYAQLKQYRKALPHIKQAIASSKKPEESWYQLNLALYFETENYASAANLLKKLIRIYPDKKKYWDQLASVYQQLRQYKNAVSVKHLAYQNGFITSEKGLLELANLFLYINSPYKSAHFLQMAFNQNKIKSNEKNWETLANAWTMAKEYDKAIQALETASGYAQKGSLLQQLGQIYVEQEKWKLANIALNKALNKGGLKNTGDVHLLLGMSYYELGDIGKAKQSFFKASKYRKNQKAAGQWLGYIKKF